MAKLCSNGKASCPEDKLVNVKFKHDEWISWNVSYPEIMNAKRKGAGRFFNFKYQIEIKYQIACSLEVHYINFHNVYNF